MFQKLNQESIAQHVTVLGWLYVASGLIGFVATCLFMFLFTGLGAAANDRQGTPVLLTIGLMVGGFVALAALPALLAGIGLLRRRAWGRILALIVGLFQLPGFPIGTALGLYTFWVLFQDAAPAYFARPAASTAITPDPGGPQ
jgi:hypothetical protein